MKKLSDREVLKEMLTRSSIEFEERARGIRENTDTSKVLTVGKKNHKSYVIVGCDFWTEFHFDYNGNLIRMGMWE